MTRQRVSLWFVLTYNALNEPVRRNARRIRRNARKASQGFATRLTMAYMVHYKKDQSPYEDWLNRRSNVIFQAHQHYCDDCMHGIFLLAPDGTSGLYYFTLSGDYVETCLFANVLIDADAKKLHIYECIFSYQNDYNYYDTNIENGDVNALQNYTEDELGEYKSFLKGFFGKDWTVSYDYTPKAHKKHMKTYRKKINHMEQVVGAVIPADIKQLIANKCRIWTDDQMSKITEETKTFLMGVFEKHGGGIPGERWGVYYPWGKTIALYGIGDYEDLLVEDA
jgi:hypothetical protein